MPIYPKASYLEQIFYIQAETLHMLPLVLLCQGISDNVLYNWDNKDLKGPGIIASGYVKNS